MNPAKLNESRFCSPCMYSVYILIITDRSKFSSDQKRLFFAVSLYPLSFSRTLLLKQQKLQTINFLKPSFNDLTTLYQLKLTATS